ncbi:hypothetical protein WA026_022428 [Henosepilachna vigintioctopunctata]|uniref:Uncharacterized protein n=1 Tax=Henosepilachna vigintioctopunctata TaxID=420089 RepID=A0AAW1U7M2_9CUCU
MVSQEGDLLAEDLELNYELENDEPEAQRCDIKGTKAISCLVDCLPQDLRANARPFQCFNVNEYTGFLSSFDRFPEASTSEYSRESKKRNSEAWSVKGNEAELISAEHCFNTSQGNFWVSPLSVVLKGFGGALCTVKDEMDLHLIADGANLTIQAVLAECDLGGADLLRGQPARRSGSVSCSRRCTEECFLAARRFELSGTIVVNKNEILEGAHSEHIHMQNGVVTDCSAVRATMMKMDMIPRISGWWMALQVYGMTVEYKAVLSRNPVIVCSVNMGEDDWFFDSAIEG